MRNAGAWVHVCQQSLQMDLMINLRPTTYAHLLLTMRKQVSSAQKETDRLGQVKQQQLDSGFDKRKES